MNIDYKRLRRDLIDYYGTAMSSNPMAVIELSKIESASNTKLIEYALKNNFDLEDYKIKGLKK